MNGLDRLLARLTPIDPAKHAGRLGGPAELFCILVGLAGGPIGVMILVGVAQSMHPRTPYADPPSWVWLGLAPWLLVPWGLWRIVARAWLRPANNAFLFRMEQFAALEKKPDAHASEKSAVLSRAYQDFAAKCPKATARRFATAWAAFFRHRADLERRLEEATTAAGLVAPPDSFPACALDHLELAINALDELRDATVQAALFGAHFADRFADMLREQGVGEARVRRAAAIVASDPSPTRAVHEASIRVITAELEWLRFLQARRHLWRRLESGFPTSEDESFLRGFIDHERAAARATYAFHARCGAPTPPAPGEPTLTALWG